MRVAYVSDILSIHDRRFLEALAAGGYDVLLLTDLPDPLPTWLHSLSGLTISLLLGKERNALAGVTASPALLRVTSLRALEKLSGRGSFSRWASDSRRMKILFEGEHLRRRAILLKFQSEIAAFLPDVVHAGWIQTSGFLAASTGARPFLLMPWGSDVLLFPRDNSREMAKATFTVCSADLITCDCYAVRDALAELFGYPEERISVIPWGIDLAKFAPRPDAGVRKQLGWGPDHIVLLSNRPLNELSRMRELLEQLPSLVSIATNVRLVVIGSGPLELDLKRLAKELGLEEVVAFVGVVPNEDVAHYLCAADIYVSLSASDGSSLALMEAMACALPPIVSDIPAHKEWVTDHESGRVIARPQDLHEAIEDLILNPSKRLALGRASHRVALERADWVQNFRRIEALYSQLVSQRLDP